MLKGNKYRKAINRIICFKLVVTMILSLFLFSFGTFDDDLVASAATTLPPGVSVVPRGKISDQDTSNFTFSNTPYLNSGPALNPLTNIFLNTPRNDGRVWTDKSVNANQAFIYDTAGGVVDTIKAPQNEFLVTLSALSQSINIEQIIVEPSDTVFVIDASGSMATNSVPGDGRSRVAVVIDALNDAIKMLMAANPNNRVSVVIYGGQFVSSQNQAKVYPVLSLGRYEIASPIFSVSGTTVTVSANIASPLQRSFVVEGGTPTQLGMRRGADVLLGVPQGLVGGSGTLFDTGTPDVTNPGSNIIVTRKPNIILMTDGEPTFAWHDYTMGAFSNWQGVTNTANWYDVGNGSAGDMGLTALTVMTAAYVKQQVRDWYYPTNPAAPGYSPDNVSKSVGFYTLGLGVNSSISNAMLSPYGTSAGGSFNAQLVTQSYNSVNYNMLTVLDTFAPGTEPSTFPYLQRGSSTAHSPVTITNAGGYVQTCNYDTMSFTAMDKAGLDEAFNTITQQIVTQGNYSTNTGTGNRAQYDGYLVFSDVIGEYMQFGDFYALWYNNIKNDGASFKDALTTATPTPQQISIYNTYRDNLMQFITKPGAAPANAFLQTDADLLISSSRAGTGGLNTGQNGNKVVYYADVNRNWVGNRFDGAGNVLSAPASASAIVELYTVQGPAVDALDGKTNIDLMLIVFQVVTVIRDGNFISYFSDGAHLACPLLVGDQIIRWYIPATLIPLRGVKQVTNPDGSVLKDDFGFDIVQVSEANPLRVMYSVAPNVSKIAGGLTALYSDNNRSPFPNSFYFYTNRWRGMDGNVQRTVSSTRNDMANMAQAFFRPSSTNEFYKQVLMDSTILKEPNVTGPTGTSPWQWGNTSFSTNVSPITTTQVQRLGNNGRIEIRALATIEISKTFSFPPGLTIDDLSDISFMIWGRDMNDGLIFRANIPFNNSWSGSGDGPYTLAVSVPPGQYVIQEIGGIPLKLGFVYPAHAPTEVLDPTAPPPLSLIRAGRTVTASFDNSYTPGLAPDPGDLWIRKIFHGLLPGDAFSGIPTEYPASIEVDIIGPLDVEPVQTQTVTLVTPGYAALLQGMVAGEYKLVERGADIGGNFTWSVKPDGFTITPEQETEGLRVIIDNTYTLPTYSIGLSKVTDPSPLEMIDKYGNLIIREPLDLTWKIERIGSFDAGGGFLKIIRWADLVNGVYPGPITDLLPGTYRITELGFNVPGFDGPLVSLTNNGVPVTLIPGIGIPVTSYSYTFTLGGDKDINLVFGFTNAYTVTPPNPPPINPPPLPPPVTPPPSPQTGQSPQSFWLALIAITLGLLLIGGAELYRRVYIEKRKPVNDKE